jgi:hypothetical protein
VCSNVETIGVQKVEVAEQGGPENGKREIPEHLINLFDKSKGELNEQEQTQLSARGNGNTSLMVRAFKAL